MASLGNNGSSAQSLKSDVGNEIKKGLVSVQAQEVSYLYDQLGQYPIFSKPWDLANNKFNSALSDFSKYAGVKREDALDYARTIVRNSVSG